MRRGGGERGAGVVLKFLDRCSVGDDRAEKVSWLRLICGEAKDGTDSDRREKDATSRPESEEQDVLIDSSWPYEGINI